MKKTNYTKLLAQGGVIAALYIVMTICAGALNLASGMIQVRVSEALCVLPCFVSSAVPGLFIGCLTSNILMGSSILDIVFGSLATLLGAYGTYKLRKHNFLSYLPPILSNTLIIPFIIGYSMGFTKGWQISFLTVFAGEVLSVGVLGHFLKKALKTRTKDGIESQTEEKAIETQIGEKADN